MHVIKKILNWLTPMGYNPDLSDTWEISNIKDHRKFMDFVFAYSKPTDFWVIDMVFTKDTNELLNKLFDKQNPIPLTKENLNKIKNNLSAFDFTTDFVHQFIKNEDDFLLVSYDNLTCCWISKRINKEQIQRGVLECGFEFIDTKDA